MYSPAIVKLGRDDITRRVAALGAPSDGGRLRLASVLVPIVDHGCDMSIILTRRTDHLAEHAGQISFPGGRREPGDSGPVATALRETREEIGLSPERIEVVGCLGVHDTTTGYSVTPVVGIVTPPVSYALDEFEVAEAFEVPLAIVLDEANYRQEQRNYNHKTRVYHVLEYREKMIWGATAGILLSLCRVLAE
jgi:8-oxo-dGTP pyrophosphatase MutT (NUDIX family)